MPLGHTHMALDGPETNLHIVYASSIIDQHKEEVFEQYDFAGPVASCKVEEVSTDAAAAYRARHGLVAGQPGIKAISETRSALTQGAVAPRTLLLISDNLPKHELLLDAALASATVVAVKYDQWSLGELIDAINKSAPAGTTFDAVGILDHGAPGRFCLLKSVGDGDVDLADLATDASIAAFFKGIGGLVKPGGRIDLLGCSVAAGPEGRALLAQVEALAGVTVTASTDKTGGAADADWEMETHGLNVAKDYFDVEALKEWKHASFIRPSHPASLLIAPGFGGQHLPSTFPGFPPFVSPGIGLPPMQGTIL